MLGIVGFALSVTGAGDLWIFIAVSGATVSSIIRIRDSKLNRRYRTSSGIGASDSALALTIAALTAGFVLAPRLSYDNRRLRSDDHLIRFLRLAAASVQAREEEFTVLKKAEEGLDSTA